jgi:hypothetical protein
MTIPTSNRELYLAIIELCDQHKSNDRSLEQYLLALLYVARPFKGQEEVSAADFYQMLSDSFTVEPVPFDESWREAYAALDNRRPGFEGWESTLIRQIVNLREMDETGLLTNEYRYFGIDSPRGARWYNFDPCGYIECAMAGSLGGWEPGDKTGRQFVPGEVAVLGADGIRFANPQDLERPVVEMFSLSWDIFKDFLECGQMYE